MPIYEYACKKCNHTLDALQRLSDEPLTDCPACGEAQLRRLISAPRFRLKGAGWYETDFKKDNQRNVLKGDNEAPKKDKAESGSGGKSDSATGDKGEAQPAAKTAADKPGGKADAKPAAAAPKSSSTDSG